MDIQSTLEFVILLSTIYHDRIFQYPNYPQTSGNASPQFTSANRTEPRPHRGATELLRHSWSSDQGDVGATIGEDQTNL